MYFTVLKVKFKRRRRNAGNTPFISDSLDAVIHAGEQSISGYNPSLVPTTFPSLKISALNSNEKDFETEN